jgi:hypothetical protein
MSFFDSPKKQMRSASGRFFGESFNSYAPQLPKPFICDNITAKNIVSKVNAK